MTPDEPTTESGRPTPTATRATQALSRATMQMSAQGSEADRSDDSFVRRAGRDLIRDFYAALRAIKLYPVENAAVQKALTELASTAQQILTEEQELQLRASGEFIFVNAIRLRIDLDNYASFSHIISMFRGNGAGSLQVHEGATPRDWMILLSVLQTPTQEPPEQRLLTVSGKLESAGVTAFTLGPPTDQASGDTEKAKERAKRTYSQSVVVAKDLMTSVRLGKSPNIKKIKRVVQGIVDQILNEETSLIGLTSIRDYDEYTFTHSVNVCIFSVAIGKRLGLTKIQLYDLGLAALFHDIGKQRVPSEVLNKSGGLTDDEWRLIAAHPWLGVLALFQVRGQQEFPYRAMVVAMEHHMKTDLTGYPRPIRPRKMSMYSKIVAVADGFDAATSRRSYQTTPLNPAMVMQEMRDNPRRGMDPVLVKAFVNLTGIYPVGTLVVLDTFELGIVHAVNPLAEMLSRPIVRVISDPMGNLVHPGEIIDLADRDAEGNFRRTIIKTENPERYGIRVGDYFI
ncbi:MAG TPA: HD-GYP domain-containing protein [Gemmatimonadaceae bacterium]|nr:HD-GYP domain-containing protein [Gemmatimonadaceae bacterium]